MILKHLLSITISFFIFSSSYAQTVPVRFQGDVSDDNGNISGASLQITQGGKVISTAATDGGGNYKFELPLGGEYLVTV